ncbi:MAG: YSC84-related protein [Steroidobacteraceae bacterium]
MSTALHRSLIATLALLVVMVGSAPARADSYSETIELFKNAGQSAEFFDRSYAYAVFPTIGKGGLGIGGALGEGRVYERGRYVGDVTLKQMSLGFQAGGQAYSQIIFLQDLRAFDEFTSGEFGFGAGVSAVAITAAASASAGTTGASAAVSGGKRDAATRGEFYKGMAVFTIAKGGLMYEAALAGQKFSYSPKKP